MKAPPRGTGADNLNGATGEDVLVAGSTSYDVFSNADLGALTGIQNEWLRSIAYATRISQSPGRRAAG